MNQYISQAQWATYEAQGVSPPRQRDERWGTGGITAANR